MVRIPLRDRHGEITAYALVDDCDARFAELSWHRDRKGYASGRAYLGLDGGRKRYRHLLLHREVLGLKTGDPRQGDHINGDRLDCRRSNLRVVTLAENNQNTSSREGSSSRFRGVHRRGGQRKWVASVKSGGRTNYLGSFEREEDAAAAAAAFRAEHMPFAVESAI